jgi:hypothetical protein
MTWRAVLRRRRHSENQNRIHGRLHLAVGVQRGVPATDRPRAHGVTGQLPILAGPGSRRP